MNDIKTVIAEYSEQFNRRLPDFFPLPDGPEKRVVEAMKYAVTNGGKRLRPYLVYETARLFGVDFSSSLRTATSAAANRPVTNSLTRLPPFWPATDY